MADPVPLVPPVERRPRRFGLHTLLLLLCTLFLGVLAADRVYEQWVLLKYEAYLDDFSTTWSENDGEAQKRYKATWDSYSDKFRARGLQHPHEWKVR